MKYFYHSISTILLCALSFNSINAQVLNVSQTVQEHDQWCWAGSSKCVLDYLGHVNSQCLIANWAWTRNDCCGNSNFSWVHPCNSPNSLYGPGGSAMDILSHFGNVQSSGIPTYLTLSEIQTEIGAGRPFCFRWGWYPQGSAGGHMLVGHGVSGNTVYYMNPWPGEGLEFANYNWMVSDGTANGNHLWTHSLKLASTPLMCNNDNACGTSPKPLTINSSCISSSCSTIGATPPSSDIPFYGSSTCTSLYQSGRYDDDVWFSITTTNSNPITIKVSPTSNLTNFDPVVGLYLGSCSNLTQVACGAQNGVGQDENLNFTPSTGTNTYLVRVFSYGIGSAYSGNFDICVFSNCSTPSQPSTITGNANPCLGSQIYSVTNISGVSYNWTLSGGGTITGTGNSATVNWTSQGTNIITVTPSNSCANGTPRTLSVAVVGSPTQPSPISGNVNPCLGSQSYSVNNVSGVSYNWALSGGGTITGAGNSANITWTSQGTYNISVTPISNCGNGSPRTLSVTVSGSIPSQPSTVSGNANPCFGDQSYSVSNVSGVTYSWSLSGGGTITSAGNSANVNWTSPGTYTLTVLPSNGCGTGTARTLSVGVTAPPSQPSSIVGNTSPCLGSQSYSITNVSGVTYNWMLSGGGTITGTGNSATVNWTSPGTYTITVTPDISCGSGTPRTLSVTVIGSPTQPSTISGNVNPCLGSQGYSVSNVSGVSYNWALSGGGTITGAGNSANISWTSQGTYTITVTPSNNCGNGAPRTLSVTVNGSIPSQPSVVSGSVNPCLGDQSYSVSNVLGVTYAWSLSGGGNITGTGNSANVSWTSPGTYTITVLPSNGCGTGTARTLSVTVTAPPSQPSSIIGNVNSCFGNQSYSVTNISGVTYNWMLSDGGTITSTGNSATVNWTSQGTHTVTVTTSNNCGSGTPRTLSVAVTATPSQPSAISGNANPCIGSQNYSVSNVIGVTYTWILSGGGTVTSSGNSATVNWTSQGTYSITVTPNNSCGNGTPQTLSVTVNGSIPSQPTLISGNPNPCLGSQNYSVTNVVGVTYTWALSGGGTITGSGNSATVNWTSQGIYTITITPSNGCGVGTPRTLSVTVNAPPSQPSSIVGNANTCLGNQTYSVSNVSGVTYNWTLSGGGTITGAGNSATVNWTSPGTYVITVTPNFGCGSGTPRTLSVAVTAPPSQPTTISGNAISCLGSQGYSISNVSGVTYTWALSGGGIITGSENSANVTWTTPGTYSITVTPGNACGNGNPSTLSVTVKAPPSQPSTISGNANTCLLSQTYSVTNVSGVTYSWNLSGGGTIIGSGSSANVNWTSPGTYDITVTPINTCGNGTPRALSVTVNPIPSVNISIATQTICSGTAINQINITNPNNVAGTTFTWSRTNTTVLTGMPANDVGSVITGALTNNTNTTQISTFTITARSNGCSSSTSSIISVNPLPIINLMPSITVSGHERIQLGGTPVAAGNGPLSYKWTPNSNMNYDTIANPIITPNISKTYTLKVTDRNGCSATKSIDVVVLGFTVFPNPTNDIVNILGSGIQNEDYRISVLDMSGKVLMTKSVTVGTNNMNEQLSLERFPKGTYLIMIQGSNIPQSLKVIKL